LRIVGEKDGWVCLQGKRAAHESIR
jgi:hypothetical protein